MAAIVDRGLTPMDRLKLMMLECRVCGTRWRAEDGDYMMLHAGRETVYPSSAVWGDPNYIPHERDRVEVECPACDARAIGPLVSRDRAKLAMKDRDAE